MYRYIDLSHTIENSMAVHPYDEGVRVYQNRFLDTDKYNDTRWETGMHAGTHIDLPSHLIESNHSMENMSLHHFIGKGCVLDVRGESVIHMKDEYLHRVKEKDIVLLYTGFGEKFGSEEYFNTHPVLHSELAEFFVKKGIKLLGMDLPAPDRYPFEIHKILFTKDIYIIENMTSLHEIMNFADFEVMAFPLKIKAEASPVRVVAKVLE